MSADGARIQHGERAAETHPPAERDAATGYITVPGAELFYETRGEGHPLILLHAAVGDLAMWDDVVPTLAQRYRVVRYDQRGFGRSHVRATVPYAFYDDLQAVLNALDIEHAHLLGCSLGGQVAVDCALAFPSLVTALIAVSAGASGFDQTTPRTVERAQEIEQAATTGDYDRAAELSLRLWLDGPLRQPRDLPSPLRERVRAMMRRTLELPGPGTPTHLEPSSATRLGEITAPTLVVVGDRDVPEALRQSELIAMHVPQARKVVIPNTAHLIALEQPERLTRVVLDFLDTVEREHE